MKKRNVLIGYFAILGFFSIILFLGGDLKACHSSGYNSVRYDSHFPYDAVCVKDDNGDVLRTKLKDLHD